MSGSRSHFAGWAGIAGWMLVGIMAFAELQAAQEATPAKEKASAPPKVPPVVLSKGHEALCKVKVGDQFPDVSLPQLDGGAAAKLSSLFGKGATVVVLWKGDRRMSREELADMGPDVVEPFEKAGVAVVGIATSAPASEAESALKAAEASFANLVDVDGKVFAQLGSEKLPRTYLLDPQGKILWFDIEYSLGTRRDLNEALRATVGEPATKKK